MAPFIRVDVWSLGANDPIITAYADAVAAMQAKPAADPTSWDYQAAIHGVFAAVASPPYNECRHGGWYFLPWHRAYLYYFERIVRAQVIANGGAATWAIPYWNYDGGGNHNELPLAFRDPNRPGGGPNPLYVPNRAMQGNAGLDPAVTSPANALGRPSFTGTSEFGGDQTPAVGQFYTQTGELEKTPHNDVHDLIGGIMSSPYTAARDPIFWLHHANIDRVWWRWQQTHANPNAPAWQNAVFPFVDAGGAPVTATCAGVEDTLNQLNYTYDAIAIALVPPPLPTRLLTVKWPDPWPEGPQSPRPPAKGESVGARQIVGATTSPIVLVGAPAQVTVAVDRRALLAVPAAERQQRVFLDVENIEAVRDPGAVYGVYVNLPEDPSDEALATHRVGNVSLFGIERMRDPLNDTPVHALRLSMEITAVLNRLAADQEWTDGGRIDVTFRPITLRMSAGAPTPDIPQVTGRHPDRPITVGRVSLYYL
jgi:tyrosinase